MTDSNTLATRLEDAAAAPFKFNPRQPISDLAAKLLAASNGLHSHPTDGTPAAEVGTSRHAWTS